MAKVQCKHLPRKFHQVPQFLHFSRSSEAKIFRQAPPEEPPAAAAPAAPAAPAAAPAPAATAATPVEEAKNGPAKRPGLGASKRNGETMVGPCRSYFRYVVVCVRLWQRELSDV